MVGLVRDALNTSVYVADEGEGIFLKIQRAMNLYDPREAILELAKGKLTTDPVNHTGEGIFFASKLFDAFDIRSGRLHFMHDHGALAAPEENTFVKTIVPVRLAQYEGEKLVSRSQAKRLSLRFERFRHVVLDFAQVVE